MLFNYKKLKPKKWASVLTYGVIFLSLTSTAYAFSDSPSNELTRSQLNSIIQRDNKSSIFQLSAEPEVLQEINNIRGSEKARSYLHAALNRMHDYQPLIQQQLNDQQLPKDLLVMPLVESGYRPLQSSQTLMKTAGIWQFMPDTANKYGLGINNNQDERLNTQQETHAALAYLKVLHTQFGNWQSSAMAYEIGENNLATLMNTVNSHDPWVLARSSAAPSDLKKFLVQLETCSIIMRHPELI